jgi:BNR repeat-like domain
MNFQQATWRKAWQVACIAGAVLLSACTKFAAMNSLQPAMESSINLDIDADRSNAGLGFAETRSFDVLVDKNRIHLIAVGTLSTADKQAVVRYVYSDDGGQHWSNATHVITPKPPSMVTRGNDIQLAVSGNKLVALWQTTGEIPGMGAMVSVYSHDGGKNWQAGSNPAANDAGDQSHIDVVGTDNGAFHAVWLDDRDENGYQGVRYGRSDDGVHWQNSITLDDSSCSCCWNKIAVSPSGALNVLYRDMEVRDMALSQSLDNGVSWQKSVRVGDFGWKFDGCPHVGGGLAFASANTIHSVVWTGIEQKQGLYYLRSVDAGKLWSAPVKLGDRAMHGDIAALGDQRVRAVWDASGSDGSAVSSAYSRDGGLTWADTIQWSITSHNAVHPRIVPAQNGFLLLWTEKHGKRGSQLVTVFVE